MFSSFCELLENSFHVIVIEAEIPSLYKSNQIPKNKTPVEIRYCIRIHRKKWKGIFLRK
jgi:hypothetical protein